MITSHQLQQKLAFFRHFISERSVQNLDGSLPLGSLTLVKNFFSKSTLTFKVNILIKKKEGKIIVVFSWPDTGTIFGSCITPGSTKIPLKVGVLFYDFNHSHLLIAISKGNFVRRFHCSKMFWNRLILKAISKQLWFLS